MNTVSPYKNNVLPFKNLEEQETVAEHTLVDVDISFHEGVKYVSMVYLDEDNQEQTLLIELTQCQRLVRRLSY